ncbi:hypothetical protein JTE90_023392 [Oedothorax gibbosus]|uniref:Major facilitator superfamily (MFS) profile domain-containing protein n=1 Tax=Oedothorax gibbosus TaxID=931172 RepID=A0AAV6UED7_9ARAC|nr:hypothetical protein JTE90_023392 [Oedothorax gibbosus]
MIYRIRAISKKNSSQCKKTLKNQFQSLSNNQQKYGVNNQMENTNGTRGRVRYFVALMCSMISSMYFVHRIILSTAIVAMVKHKNLEENHYRNYSTDSCPITSGSHNETDVFIEGELDWSSELQGYVLGAGFLGCIITQLPGGTFAEKWGAKRTLVIANILAAICTFITPMATWWNVYAVIFVQFLRGLTQGVNIPVTFVLMSNWFPRQERGFLSTLVLSGYAFGAAIAGVPTGLLCDVPQLGWPSAFYSGGVFAAIMSLLFAFTVYETPASHPTISQEELKYITEGQECDLSLARPPTPWKKILTSEPVYALVVGLFGQYWQVTYFLSVHPTYMGTILHFSMTKNGAASNIPISIKSVGGIIASFLTNWITKKKYVGVSALRKSFNFVGSLGFSACLLGAYWAGCDKLINIFCFTLSLFCSGAALSGAMITGGDMSPRFCGSLMGFATTIASTSAAIIPVMVGNLTENQTIEEWQIVFFISIAIVLSCGLIFNIFGSAEIQPWNDPESQDKLKAMEKEFELENSKSSVTRF